jgi:Tol biopolymer transport system component
MVGVGNIAISPDGAPTRFAYLTNGGVAVRSLDQLDTRVINAGNGLTSQLFFSRDGRWIGYIDDGLRYRQAADRSGSAERVIVTERLQHPSGFAPDGRLLITERAPDNGRSDILAYSFDTRRVEPVITEGDEGAGAVSPDGRWIFL